MGAEVGAAEVGAAVVGTAVLGATVTVAVGEAVVGAEVGERMGAEVGATVVGVAVVGAAVVSVAGGAVVVAEPLVHHGPHDVDDGRAAPAKPARIKRQQTPALGLLSRGGVVDDEEDEDMGEGEEGGE